MAKPDLLGGQSDAQAARAAAAGIEVYGKLKQEEIKPEALSLIKWAVSIACPGVTPDSFTESVSGTIKMRGMPVLKVNALYDHSTVQIKGGSFSLGYNGRQYFANSSEIGSDSPVGGDKRTNTHEEVHSISEGLAWVALQLGDSMSKERTVISHTVNIEL